MSAARRVIDVGTGGVVGLVFTAVIAVGEAQVRLAAGGAAVGFGDAPLVLVDPQWATAIATALALVLIGAAILVWVAARGRVTRAFWFAATACPIVVVVLGAQLAPIVFDPERRGGWEALLAATSQSPLLFLGIFGAWLVALAPVPARSTTVAPAPPTPSR